MEVPRIFFFWLTQGHHSSIVSRHYDLWIRVRNRRHIHSYMKTRLFDLERHTTVLLAAVISTEAISKTKFVFSVAFFDIIAATSTVVFRKHIELVVRISHRHVGTRTNTLRSSLVGSTPTASDRKSYPLLAVMSTSLFVFAARRSH